MGAFFASPRDRRLQRDLRDMEELREESTILDFEVSGDPPDRYVITFDGPGLAPDGKGKVRVVGPHQVELKLGTEYPRTLPQMRWLTPITHPNIMGGGSPCLGTYTMTPNRRLTDVVELLWDMQRLALFGPEVRSGSWPEIIREVGAPLDPRVLRDRAAAPPPGPAPEKDEPDMLIMEGRVRMGVAARESYSACKVVYWKPGSPSHLTTSLILRDEMTKYEVRILASVQHGSVAVFPIGCLRGLPDFQASMERYTKGMGSEERVLCAEDLDAQALIDFAMADLPLQGAKKETVAFIGHILEQCLSFKSPTE
jgi:ubiquitin-protein ligase